MNNFVYSFHMFWPPSMTHLVSFDGKTNHSTLIGNIWQNHEVKQKYKVNVKYWFYFCNIGHINIIWAKCEETNWVKLHCCHERCNLVHKCMQSRVLCFCLYFLFQQMIHRNCWKLSFYSEFAQGCFGSVCKILKKKNTLLLLY